MTTRAQMHRTAYFARRFANEAWLLRDWWNYWSARQRHAANIRAWKEYFRQPQGQRDGKVVLLASFLPIPYCFKIEAIWAKALAARGYRPICLYSGYSAVSGVYHRAFGTEAYALDSFLPWEMVHRIKKLSWDVANAPVNGIASFAFMGVPVGSYVIRNNYLSKFIDTPYFDATLRQRAQQLLQQGCLSVLCADRAVKKFDPALIMSVEKGSIGTAEIFHAALNADVDYVQWVNCHQSQSLMLKRYNRLNSKMHPSSISEETWRRCLASPFEASIGHDVHEQFRQGYVEGKWFVYKRLAENTNPIVRDSLVARYGLDPGKKIAVIFSHVLDDANLFYGEDLFEGGFSTWLVKTVEAAARNPHVNWLLKIHPANRFRRKLTGEAGEYAELTLIRQQLGRIPDNLRIMLPEDDVNPYFLFGCIDYGITVRGTVGAELPCFGVPVVTGGTGRYSGFGFTEESPTAAAYLDKIRAIETIAPLSRERTELALRHAYLFFRIRPARYDGFAQDIYPEGGPLFRDLRPLGEHCRSILDHPQLARVIDWLVASRQEDFLSNEEQVKP